MWGEGGLEGVVVKGLTEEAGTSNSFSESRSFSGRRFLGVHEWPRAPEEKHNMNLKIM